MDIAVFLDRDGVITEDPPHYSHRIDQLKIIPKSAEAIQLLNKSNFKVIIISNQSGVARGYFNEDDVIAFNNELKIRLKKSHACIDAVYYCPHHPEGINSRYKIDCECRKPKPGLLLLAASQLNINLAESFVIGDKWSDIQAGENAGCKTILVLTGHGRDEIKLKNMSSKQIIVNNLFDAVTIILTDKSKS